MRETTKAMMRRIAEDERGEFPWHDIMSSNGLDVGSGDDPLPGTVAFDIPDGAGDDIGEFFHDEKFNYVHGSQVLEHAINPVVMLRSWLEVLKPGGHIVCTIPSWEFYEGFVWPSRFNAAHQSTWSMCEHESPAPTHCKLPEWLEQFPVEILLCRLVTTNYDFSKVFELFFDQTLDAAKGVECFIEFVLKKL